MKMLPFKIKPLCSALIVASLLTACGGGGSPAVISGSSTNNFSGGSQPPVYNTGAPKPPTQSPPPPSGTTQQPGDTPSDLSLPASVADPMTMLCVDGPGYQCSGEHVIRSDNGVAFTRSGVQAYGKSTSDLVRPVADPTRAWGLAPATGGMAEIRLAKNDQGVVSNPALLLSNLGLSWDGKVERPQIVDVFLTTYGRVKLDANGKIVPDTLPPSSDPGFFDYAYKDSAATQANYANNRYFPRTAPSRCATGTSCPTLEMEQAFQYQAGNWRTGDRTPDWASGQRRHGDGDVHAGDNKPGSNPSWLPGGSGTGVPFPGSKGYRDFSNWSFKYSNLGTWVTQDTVEIVEWTHAAGIDEHSALRRGAVAFGEVSDPATIPTTGSASYSGIAYGWYDDANPNTAPDNRPRTFWGAVTVTVNFVTREVIVDVENTVTYDAAATPLPIAFKTSTKMGAAGQTVANYLTGPVDNGMLKGGVSGRYFGPVSAGNGQPPEIGGAFTLSNSTTRQTVIGGFIARKK